MFKKIIARLRIPKNTPYCYKLKKGKGDCWLKGYKIKRCPYWKELDEKDEYGNSRYYCKYLNLKGEYQGDNLLWDMCKECGINENN